MNRSSHADGLREAISGWTDALGADRVSTEEAVRERLARTTTTCGTRPACVLYPTTTAEVQEVVCIAAAHGTVLYPISRGKNWGYGDACAPIDDAAIVDLSRMNRIIEVNTELGYAVIEPGVSQQQLYEYLTENRTGLWMDCTGAGTEASLMGNTLDRGFGHTRYGDHVATTCGMEVVLADGRVLETGFGHYSNARTRHVYRYGVGPFLDGLFCQSGMGIVTRIGLWLMPEPEAFCCFAFTVPDYDDLAVLIDRLRPLRMQGILSGALHIGNDLRVLSNRTHYPWEEANGITPLPEPIRARMREELAIGAWSGASALTGTHAQVRGAKRAVRRALRGLGELHFGNDRIIQWGSRFAQTFKWTRFGRRIGEQLTSLRPVYGLLKGIPNNEALRGAEWRLRSHPPHPVGDPLDHSCGLLWTSPVLPLSGSHAIEVVGLTEPIYKEYGFEPLITFTMISERAMMGVFTIAFDKGEGDESKQAHACYKALVTSLINAGYPPYRVSLEGMPLIRSADDTFWDVAAEIKRALDPKDIIARGRYIPPLGDQ